MTVPKALFLDIDGTILRSDRSMSERVIKAIKQIEKTGTIISLATGRSWNSLKKFYQQLELTDPVICYNGACIVGGADGNLMFESNLDEKVSRYAIEQSRKHHIEFLAYQNSQLIYEYKGERLEEYHQQVNLDALTINFDSLDTLKFTKCIFLSTNKNKLESIRIDMEKQFSPNLISITYSDPRYLEILAGGVDKGRGLRKVCQHYNIAVSDSVAIGDGWNDLSLLKSAGDAWIMATAPLELRKLFPESRIAPSSDIDGAAMVMEAMLEGRNPVFPKGAV